MRHKIRSLFVEFFQSEKTAGLILVICTALSIILTNSPLAEQWLAVWNIPIAHHHLSHWINDGLMAVFFLMVGLEIKRELLAGELKNPRKALLPIIAACGGMFVPALIHFSFNVNTPTQAGVGIPMATDIAFSLGVLSLLGRGVPASLRIFLAALAIIDDLGAIVVIAIFYAQDVSFVYLSLALLVWAVLFALNKFKIQAIPVYILLGIILWYCMLQSGVHASIAGVMLAFALPFNGGSDRAPSYRVQHALHPAVTWVILPLFALANTCLSIDASLLSSFTSSNALGIILGLVLGKPIGIVGTSLLLVALGLCHKPSDSSVIQMIGVGFLGGIGFTMSIFVATLAFSDVALIEHSKLYILSGSLLAGILGFVILKFFSRSK